MNKYLSHHIRNFLSSLGEICRQPINSLLTIVIISIALFIPAGLLISVHNIHSIYSSWENSPQITVFLKKDVTAQEVLQLQETIQQNNIITSIQRITAKEILDEFSSLAGESNVATYLDLSLFDDVLFLNMQANASTANIQQFVDSLKNNPAIDLINLDLDWIHKLKALVKLLESFTEILAIILSLAVILIINQMVKLRLQAKQELILVAKLMGATNSFIRREFLYLGFWYGLISAIFCWLLIKIAILFIHIPLKNLAVLYQTNLQLSGVNLSAFASICGISIILSISGACLAVNKYLGNNHEFK